MHLTDKELIFISNLMNKLEFKIGAGEDFITATALNQKVIEELKSRQNAQKLAKENKSKK